LKVKVKFFAIARELAGTPEEELELDDGSTAKELLELVAGKYGESFREFIFDAKTGLPRSNLQFLVGENLLADLDGLQTVLPDGAAFAIIPPVGGG